MASISFARAAAVRFFVPLNSRCSMKCAPPSRPARSTREPLPTQTPSETVGRPASSSVTTRTPLGSRVRPKTCGPAVNPRATGRAT